MNILVIGLGNMGKAIINGMLNDGVNPNNIHAVDISEKAKTDALKMGIKLYNKPPQNIKPNLILIAIKPQLVEKVLPLYKKFSSPNCTFLSIMAGVTLTKLENILGENSCIIRSMPNTPASIGNGMTVLVANKNILKNQKEEATKLLATTGETAWIENEDLMDTVTAISGSGPAYFFLIMEALTLSGIKNGLPEELAKKLAVTTAWGAGNLSKQQENTYSPQQLRQMVTSPGGTTEAGLKVLNQENIFEIIDKTVVAAMDISRKL